MGTHTTLELDQNLLREAQEILGTTEVVETVHRALEEVVNRGHERAAVAREGAYRMRRLTPEEQERALAAVERARVLQAELTAKYGLAVPSSWELLEASREERNQDQAPPDIA